MSKYLDTLLQLSKYKADRFCTLNGRMNARNTLNDLNTATECLNASMCIKCLFNSNEYSPNKTAAVNIIKAYNE